LLFKSLPGEIEPTEAAITGAVPAWLSGSLLRTGPGKFEMGESQYRHWFDGQAVLHKFSVFSSKIIYSNKFLRSDAYKDGTANNRIMLAEFATVKDPDPNKGGFGRFFSHFTEEFRLTDNGVVNVMKLGGAWVAMTETPDFNQFNPETLETIGHLNYCKEIPSTVTCAHPHEESDGTVYGLSVFIGKSSSYNLFQSFLDNKPNRLVCSISRDKTGYIHSVGMTEKYCVVVEAPFLVNPLALLVSGVRGKSYYENFWWYEDQPAKFFVIEKISGKVVEFHSAPFFFSHHINAFEENGSLYVDIANCLKDPSFLEEHYVKNLRTRDLKKKPKLGEVGEVRRYRIPVDGSQSPQKELEYKVLLKDYFELPKINEAFAKKKYSFAYGVGNENNSLFDYLIKLDVRDGTSKKWHEANCHASEPVFVADPNGGGEEDAGVVLSTVMDIKKKHTFLLILDAKTFTEVARAVIPVVLPYPLHGQFATTL